MQQDTDYSMLVYMRTIWRQEYWETRDWDILVHCMKLVRRVDMLNKANNYKFKY